MECHNVLRVSNAVYLTIKIMVATALEVKDYQTNSPLELLMN